MRQCLQEDRHHSRRVRYRTMTGKRHIINSALMFCLVLAARARADDPWARILAPRVVQSDVDAAIHKLSLTAPEEQQIRARFAAFTEQFSQAAAAVRAKLNGIGAGEGGSYEEVQWHWQDERLRIVAEFENDVMAQMPDEQRRKTW